MIYRQQSAQEEGEAEEAAADGLNFHVRGALYVSLYPSALGSFPVPLYLNHTSSSCGVCRGALTRVCSHISIAQESGAPHRSHRASAQSSVQSLGVSAVSRLPIPILECLSAVRSNEEGYAQALKVDTFVVNAPLRCEFCT